MILTRAGGRPRGPTGIPAGNPVPRRPRDPRRGPRKTPGPSAFAVSAQTDFSESQALRRRRAGWAAPIGRTPAPIGQRGCRSDRRALLAPRPSRAPEQAAASPEPVGERGNAGGCEQGGRRAVSALRQVGGLDRQTGAVRRGQVRAGSDGGTARVQLPLALRASCPLSLFSLTPLSLLNPNQRSNLLIVVWLLPRTG